MYRFSMFPVLLNQERMFALVLLMLMLFCSSTLLLRLCLNASVPSTNIDGKLGVVEKRTGEKQHSTLCCDRSDHRSDICHMKGDIRTNSLSSSILLYEDIAEEVRREELIKPYTRKWEKEVMKRIQEIQVRDRNQSESLLRCQVKHRVPGIVFSTGGYTGNVYHEFNDGLLPLYITVERYRGEVVLVVVEYHDWWMTKYQSVVKQLTNYELVDFSGDQRVHCFPEMIVGLKIHGELSITPSLCNGKTINDFQTLLGKGLHSRRGSEEQKHDIPSPTLHLNSKPKPLMVIMVRERSRVLLNLKGIEKTCQRVGFQVRVLNPKIKTQVSHIFAVLNSADAMMGVHGAALTHFLFMHPTSVFVQIIPLGLSWPAQAYYGEPATKAGLRYIEYQISAEESSLYKEYGAGNIVITDPDAINKKGWLETKRVYLDRQNVSLDLKRLAGVLTEASSQIRNKLGVTA